MAEDDIVVTIKTELEGADEVEKKLKAIADSAPEESIKLKVEVDADDATKEIDKFKDTAKEVGEEGAIIKVEAEGSDDAVKALEEVKDAATALGEEETKVKVEADGADDAKEAIEEVKKEAEDLSESPATLKIETEGVDEASAKVKEVEQAVNDAGIAFEFISGAIKGFAEAFTEELNKGKEAAEALGDALRGLEGAGDSMTALGDGAKDAAESSDGLKSALENSNTAATVASGVIDVLNYKNAQLAKAAADAGAGLTAGAQGAAALATAAARASSYVGQVATAGAQAATGIAQVGVAATAASTGIAAIGTSAAGSAASVGLFAGAIAALRGAFSGLGSAFTSLISQFELTRSNIRTLSATGRLLNLPTGGITSFISVLARLSNIIGPTGAIAIGFAAIGASFIKLGTSALEAQKGVQSMADQIGTSFKSMEATQSTFEKMGVSAKTFGEVHKKMVEDVVLNSGKLSNAVAESADKTAAAFDRVVEARMKLNEANAKVTGGAEAEEAVRKGNEFQRSLLAQRAAARELGEAIRAAMTQASNDIGPVLEKVKQLEQGFKGVKFESGTEISTIIEAVKVRLGEAAQSGENFYVALGKIIQAAPKLEAIQIGKAFGFSEADVARIQKATDITKAFIDELKAAKDVETPNLAGVQALGDAFTTLKEAWNDFKKTIGESNIAGLLAAALGGALQIITTLLKGIEAIIRFIDIMITGFRKVAAFLTTFTGLGQALTGSAEGAKKLQDAISGVNDATGKARTDVGDRLGGGFNKAGQAVNMYANELRGLSQIQLDARAELLRQQWINGTISLEEYKNKLLDLKAVTKPDEAAEDRLRQQWINGSISLEEYKTKLLELKAQTKPDEAAAEALRKQWIDGSISLEDYKKKLLELKAGLADVSKQKAPDPLTDASKGVDTYKNKIDALAKNLKQATEVPEAKWDKVTSGAEKAVSDVKKVFANIDITASLKAPDWNKLVEGLDQVGKRIKDAFSEVNLADTLKAPDWDKVTDGVERAGKKIKDAFQDLNLSEILKAPDWDKMTEGLDGATEKIRKAFSSIDLSEGLKAPDWSKLGEGMGDLVKNAEDTAKDIEKVFSGLEKDLGKVFRDIEKAASDTKIKMDWDDVVKGAEKAAQNVEQAFGSIRLSEVSGFSFEPIIEAGRSAVQTIEQAFQGISLAGVTLDFSGVIAAGSAAAQQIATSIQTTISAIDFSSLSTAAQTAFTAMTTAVETAFTALSTAAATAATGVNTAISSITFDGLISKINDVISAFQRMEAAANAAAQAAASASAAGAGGYAMGGLFRGRPGRDTNLAWLTDNEFIMRPEAVLKYGVDFMRMINALAFPSNGYREGGLNRVVQTISGGISAFRDGGLVMPRIMVPAFAAGGLNSGDSGGGSREARSKSQRPLSLTIGGETFRGLTVPEDTAKALERASTSRQIGATGLRPRWNK